MILAGNLKTEIMDRVAFIRDWIRRFVVPISVGPASKRLGRVSLAEAFRGNAHWEGVQRQMSTVFFDTEMSDAERRRQLYQGDLFVFSPRKSSLELCKFAQMLVQDAFAPYDPRRAQYGLAVEKYVEILAVLKPKFIHHPTCKELIRAILTELGCDTSKTYFDVPRLRTMTHGDYLTAGLAYAFHPHRDTWFSAPPAS